MYTDEREMYQKLIDSATRKHLKQINALVEAYILGGGERSDLRFGDREGDTIDPGVPLFSALFSESMGITDLVRKAIARHPENIFTTGDLNKTVGSRLSRVQLSMTLKRLKGQGEIDIFIQGKGSKPNTYIKLRPKTEE